MRNLDAQSAESADVRGGQSTLAAGDPRHGTRNGYSNLGCRCEPCREAHRISCMEWRHRSGYSIARDFYFQRRWLDAWARPCGSESKYRLGCRCDNCTTAASVAKAGRRGRRSVPCSSCGSARTNPSDLRRANDTGLCLSCYRASVTKAAA